ncbi:MAG: aspartate--tRNA ligase [Simkaniaceae bacterium]
MFDYRRSHNCGALNRSHIGQTVTLSGWVHRRRDHGGLIFVDLRDRFGLTQLVFNPKTSSKTHQEAENLRSEWVISIIGKVIARSEGMTNSKLSTGEIEVEVEKLQILSKAKTPPFIIDEERSEAYEDLRLKYRYLDIRRGLIAKNLEKRHLAMQSIRNFLSSEGFLEISTPILARSTPEGARDYLVPSRLYPGNFFALPQSPQIFKQLLMLSGMDRYFQIAPCFRDEDLRSDRQPEFTQIDLEMSFGYPEDIKRLMENLLKRVFKEVIDADIETPFPEMSYAYCMEHYGTDRPDLRFDMKLIRIDQIAQESDFSVFKNEISEGGTVKGLCVKNGAELSRKEIESYIEFVKNFGLQGLAWMKKTEEGLSSNIVKFFPPHVLTKLEACMKAETGDLLLFGAGKEERVNQALDHLRRHIARQRNLINPHAYRFCWVVDFPLFAWDEENKRYESMNHPFTMPNEEDISLLDQDPLKVRSLTYDVILNGYEIGGGSKRIYDFELQKKIFSLLSLSPSQIEEKFGFFTEALQYGTPPHLGIALGFDRVMMVLCGTENIREVIAFPKTQKASDLMMQCPEKVDPLQLQELNIHVEEEKQIPWT